VRPHSAEAVGRHQAVVGEERGKVPVELPEPVEQLQAEDDAEKANRREIRLSEIEAFHPTGSRAEAPTLIRTWALGC
jgi:hypothetical protein